ncbi:MFS transporter [Rhizomonospora bruguierae]|uniref:MFS transporter n=1 Tax=Rhizomonospora bruguierae TaxID=1581705 RepID=UPI0020BED2FB|nr:MFS transporter [Micromonospora sp. NBRC 107566]
MPSPYRPVLRHPVLRRLLPGFAVSAVGDGMSLVGISWLALDLAPPGRGPAWVAVALAAYSLPSAAGVVLLGRYLGGRPAAQLGLWDAVLRGVLLGAIPVLHLLGALTLPAYVALLGAASVLHSWGQAGRYTLLTELLPDEHRLAGNALLSIFNELGVLLGPALAGLVIAAVGAPAVLAVDAATFLALAAAYRFGVPTDRRRPTAAPSPGAGAQGWRVIRADPRLLGLLVLSFGFFALYGPVEVALPIHVADELHAPATLLATYFTVFGVGAFAGALLAGYLRAAPLWPVTIGIVLGWGVCLLPLGLGAPAAVTMVSFALGGLIWAPYPATSTALFQRSTSTDQLPQVLAAQGGLLVVALPMGTLAGGPLATVFGGRGTVLLSAVATIALGLVAAVLARPRRSGRRQDGRGPDEPRTSGQGPDERRPDEPEDRELGSVAPRSS